MGANHGASTSPMLPGLRPPHGSMLATAPHSEVSILSASRPSALSAPLPHRGEEPKEAEGWPSARYSPPIDAPCLVSPRHDASMHAQEQLQLTAAATEAPVGSVLAQRTGQGELRVRCLLRLGPVRRGRARQLGLASALPRQPARPAAAAAAIALRRVGLQAAAAAAYWRAVHTTRIVSPRHGDPLRAQKRRLTAAAAAAAAAVARPSEAVRGGAGGALPHQPAQSKRLLIESRWESKPLALAGKLRPQRLNT
jgi:hypothetical protein